MAERGLKASTEGIAKANQALIRNSLNKTALARDLGLSRATVTNFFRVIPIERLNFEEICKRLGLNWQEIVDIPVCKSHIEEHQNTTSKNFDCLGREDAIAGVKLQHEVFTILQQATLLQIAPLPESIKQLEEALENIPSLINEKRIRKAELLELNKKQKKEKLNAKDDERLRFIQKDITLQYKQEFLARDTNLSVFYIKQFFDKIPIEKSKFIKICFVLNIDWKIFTDIYFVRTLVLLVPQIRLQYSQRIRYFCGRLHVLYLSKSLEIDDLYVDVNILDNPPSYQWLDFTDIPQVYNAQTHEFDRLGLGKVSQARVAGVLAVEKYQNLMVLGKPGAGKSTFLKHIAVQCNQGTLEAERVPIFIGIKQFADDSRKIGEYDLLNYIRKEFEICGITEAALIDNLLEYGRLLILLDGLDEVSQESSVQTIQCINSFCNIFFKNKFIITCRIAAKKYKFFSFKDIEVADFTLEQIKAFAKNWFMAVDNKSEEDGIFKAYQFIEQLNYPENQQLQDIAVTPILLTLLCLAFQQKTQFPSNRATLYKRGIEALLIKWDEARGIKRDDVYRQLSLEHKIELLTQVATNTFENNRYFFTKDEIQDEIYKYISTLNFISNDTATLKNNSRAVLESIEAQHGLVVERAQELYSFSHLTFQEYFTATKFKALIDNSDNKVHTLLLNISDERWREVFSIATNMTWTSEQIIFLKSVIDNFISSDVEDELQELLLWVKQKSNSVIVKYKLATARCFYFSLALDIIYNSKNSLTSNIDFTLVFDIDEQFAIDIAGASNYVDSLTLANATEFALDLNLINKIRVTSAAAPIDTIAISQNCTSDSQLKKSLIQLEHRLPQWDITGNYPDDNNEINEITEYDNWWKENGEDFVEKLRNIIITHRNIGHNWEFINSQNYKLLKQYYYANKLLVNCLNNADKAKTITSKLRSHIEDTILLPIAEIEKRPFKN
ncbi:MAG: NACHT domain-containing NTPase [Nostoc sp.]|uniref:NACHT domain-containing NTPase n=1 Tax=Nostoc sp. TaxID=1180 RepID=UPI002FFAA5BE